MHAILHNAINLPDLDIFPQSGLSDPYVKLEVGSVTGTSSVVEESLNPVRTGPAGISTWREISRFGLSTSPSRRAQT